MLKLSNINKTYVQSGRKIAALRDINFHVKAGEFVSLIGSSGSGKSTLMHILGCLDRADSGSYLLEGEEIFGKSSDGLSRIRGEKIGFVFQNYKLIPRLTAMENVVLPLILLGENKVERQALGQAALAAVGLKDLANHKPTQMSGGQQQRVAIARAIVGRPRLILADEPTGNLDPQSASEILALLKDLNHKGNTLVLITHDMDIASHAHRILRLEEGRLF